MRRLAALFALDAFAGGFIVQSFMVFWFGRQFGADAQLMGLVFFGVGLLQAASSVIAGWLAARIGMLNTMVFIAPAVERAAGPHPVRAVARSARSLLLLARSALSQMDVPARQAYVAALVDPAERTAAAGYTNAARHVVRPAGPILASASMGMAAGLPFLVAGGPQGRLRRRALLHVPPGASAGGRKWSGVDSQDDDVARLRAALQYDPASVEGGDVDRSGCDGRVRRPHLTRRRARREARRDVNAIAERGELDSSAVPTAPR